MGLNTRFGKVAEAVSALLDITWSTGEPTAANTQTIADGGTPTVAELGQSVQNINTIVTALIADVEALRTQLNLGE
jgi:hypothetical protein